MSRKQKSTFILPLIILVIVAIFSFLLLKFSPFGSWEGKTRFTVAVAGNSVLVVSYNPFDNSLSEVLLPQDMYVETTFGYGNYRLGKVFEVGELDKRGGELLKTTVSETLGVSLDGFVKLNNQDLPWEKTEKNFFLNLLISSPRVKTDLSVLDLGRFALKAFFVKSPKITFLNLQRAGVLETEILPDGNKVLTVNSQLDRVLKDLFREDSLILEKLELTVFNSTKIVGLAEKASRLLGSMGLLVVTTANYVKPLSSCEIYTTPSLVKTLTVKKLARVFACTVKNEVFGESRSDISLVLGEKYGRLFRR